MARSPPRPHLPLLLLDQPLLHGGLAVENAAACLDAGRAFLLRLPAGDRERMAAMLEVIASTLGKTIAIVRHGDPATVDKLILGCEGQVQQAAVEFAPLIALRERTNAARGRAN